MWNKSDTSQIFMRTSKYLRKIYTKNWTKPWKSKDKCLFTFLATGTVSVRRWTDAHTTPPHIGQSCHQWELGPWCAGRHGNDAQPNCARRCAIQALLWRTWWHGKALISICIYFNLFYSLFGCIEACIIFDITSYNLSFLEMSKLWINEKKTRLSLLTCRTINTGPIWSLLYY